MITVPNYTIITYQSHVSNVIQLFIINREYLVPMRIENWVKKGGFFSGL